MKKADQYNPRADQCIVLLGAEVSSSIPEQVIQALQITLAEVEASSGVPPDDPALLALKGIVFRRIADLELMKTQRQSLVTQKPEDSSPASIEVLK